MRDFNQAIAVNPKDAAAYLDRGNLLGSQNQFCEFRRNPAGDVGHRSDLMPVTIPK
jgi:hypothetical protein